MFLFSLAVAVKKEGFGGGGTRTIKFIRGQNSKVTFPILKTSGKTLIVTIGEGLPSDTRVLVFIVGASLCVRVTGPCLCYSPRCPPPLPAKARIRSQVPQTGASEARVEGSASGWKTQDQASW